MIGAVVEVLRGERSNEWTRFRHKNEKKRLHSKQNLTKFHELEFSFIFLSGMNDNPSLCITAIFVEPPE